MQKTIGKCHACGLALQTKDLFIYNPELEKYRFGEFEAHIKELLKTISIPASFTEWLQKIMKKDLVGICPKCGAFQGASEITNKEIRILFKL